MNDDLHAAIRKLVGYAFGWYNPEYIHMTKDEALAPVTAWDTMIDKVDK